ncbi:unnamed protein product [Symbiodinium natans]|uniref:Uncharacterized protein n=1 Tax=Symbiodinium natans TaxID=878477 RepID=A0A812V1D8_9DINO|nr:unnamed protein product [Symbiodinium natans]
MPRRYRASVDRRGCWQFFLQCRHSGVCSLCLASEVEPCHQSERCYNRMFAGVYGVDMHDGKQAHRSEASTRLLEPAAVSKQKIRGPFPRSTSGVCLMPRRDNGDRRAHASRRLTALLRGHRLLRSTAGLQEADFG